MTKPKPTYAGKISNAGTQRVEAIFSQPEAKGTKIITGKDLRSKKDK